MRPAERIPRSEVWLLVALPLVSTALAVASQYLGWDLRLERHFLDARLNDWPYRDAWLANEVMHVWGRRFFALVGLIQGVLLAASFFVERLRPWRRLMVCTLVAMGSGPMLIGFLKSHTHIAAPWDLRIFGGQSPLIRLFQAVPAGLPIGHAFPAGHASGGFMLMTLYFTLRYVRPRLRLAGLGLGLVLGFAFGIAQQARGAHFLSHDLISLAICWVCAWGTFSTFQVVAARVPGPSTLRRRGSLFVQRHQRGATDESSRVSGGNVVPALVVRMRPQEAAGVGAAVAPGTQDPGDHRPRSDGLETPRPRDREGRLG
jgi:membrane-associated PAP2 superfamily phosphatase